MHAINKVYESILKFTGAYPDKEGYIYQKFRGKEFPFVIDGVSVVMPYDNHLQNPQDKIIFHPLMENHLRGESDITAKLRRWVNVRLNFTVAIIAQSLIKVVALPEFHSKLKPEQAELLLKVREADSTTEANFVKLMTSGCKTDPESYYINIYPRRGGDYQNKRYACVGVVVFPFYLNLLEDKVDKIRVKDKATFKEIMEFMFPDIQNKEAYNYGSQSMVAKFMDALMMTAGNIASRINELLHMYHNYIEGADELMFSEDWMDYFEKLDDLVPEIRRIPMQGSNEGSLLNQPAATAVTAVTQPVVQQQVHMPQQMQQPMQPTVQKTASGALDFRSVLAANPVLAMQPNPLAGAMLQQGMQQMPNYQAPPTWLAMAAPANMPQQMQPSNMGMYPQQQMPMQQQPQLVQTQAGVGYYLPNGQFVLMQQPGMQQQMPMQQQMQPAAPGWGDIKNLIRA